MRPLAQDGTGDTRQLIFEFAKFGLVGIVNTAVGLLIIICAMSLLGFSPIFSNVLGYTFGLLVSFTLNRKFTFADRQGGTRQLPAFLVVFAVAYVINLVVLSELLLFAAPIVAQVCAMAAYTVSFFLLSRIYVFAKSDEPSGWLPRLLSKLIESPISMRSGLVIVGIMIGDYMLPLAWTGNEINYFDLAYRLVRPDLFTEYHAVFDSSNARFFSLYLIGQLVNVVGYEASHVVLTLLVWVGLSIGITSLARAAKVSLAIVVLAIFAFFELNQALMGGEWIVEGVEAKVFAYICVLFSLAAGLKRRGTLSVILAVLATYMHFLVGGFWGLAAICLLAVQGARPQEIAKLTAVFFALISPIFLLLLSERIGIPPLDETGVDLSVNQIYAQFRNPHHVAPFLSAEWFREGWLAGTIWTAISFSVLLFVRRSAKPAIATTILWVAGLNLYLLGALAISYFDRSSFLVAPLYLFRPASLILLLTLFLGLQSVLQQLPAVVRGGLAGLAMVMFAVFTVPYFLDESASIVDPLTLAEELSQPQAEVIDWLRNNTTSQEPILFSKWPDEPNQINSLGHGLERLTQRPTFAEFKFVPTGPVELLRWYKLIQWKNSVFEEGCDVIADHPVAYLIMFQAEGQLFSSCTIEAWSNSDFSVLKVVEG